MPRPDRLFPARRRELTSESVPAPSSFIGHEVGEWHVTHDKLVGYMKLLDGISGRAVWEEYGKSWEGRPLGQLIITSEENMGRLEEITA